MNFGIKLTAIAIHFSVVCAYSQDWNTSLNNIPIGGANKFGTNNCVPVDIYTRNQLRLTIDTNGVLRSTNLAGTGGSFLRVTSDGELIRADQTPGDVETWECNMQMPWVRGGNTVGSALYGNLIGTCDNYDFILKAYNKQALFVKAANSYIGIGHNNITPSAQLDIFNPSNSNTSHFKIHGDADGTVEAGSDLNLIHNGTFSLHYGSFLNKTLMLQSDNIGRVGIGGVAGTSQLTLHSSLKDGLLNYTNSNTSKALVVYNYAYSSYSEKFRVFGDGRTTIGDVAGATNAAMFNVNSTPSTEAINVFNASSSANNKNVFRVLEDGKTMIGSENSSPNAGLLNINVNNSEAINVFDGFVSTNDVVFKVQAQGKTVVGKPLLLSNTATLNVNGNSGQLFHINDHANPNGTKLVFKVEDQGKTTIGGDVNAPNAAFVNINVNTSNGLTNVLDIFDGGSGSQGMVKVRIKANGNIFCREINVIPQAMQVPDYVFGDEYSLRTIEELANYLKENKHLPNVPSATELEKNGMGLMDMQLTQLEKIEEAFLYIIQLKKENELLRERLDKLETLK